MAAQTAVSEQRLDWMLATLLEKITERGGSVSNRVKTLLTRFDLDNSGELEMDEFRSCLEDFLAGLQDCEFEALAQRFDSDGSGSVSIPEFTAELTKLAQEKEENGGFPPARPPPSSKTTTGTTVRCLAALGDPYGTVIADGGDGSLKLWDAQGYCIRTTGPQEVSITSVAVVFKSVVLAGRDDGSLTLFDPYDCGIRTISGHDAAVWALASLPNKRVVAADGDGVLKVWRANIWTDLVLGLRHALTCLQTLRGHARAAFCLVALPDGRIVSGSMDRTLRFWAPVGTQIDRGARDAPVADL